MIKLNSKDNVLITLWLVNIVLFGLLNYRIDLKNRYNCKILTYNKYFNLNKIKSIT